MHDLMPQQQRRASGRHAASHQQQQQYSCKQHARALAAAGDLMAQEVAAGVDRDTPPAAVLTSNCDVSMSAQDACTTPTCTALDPRTGKTRLLRCITRARRAVRTAHLRVHAQRGWALRCWGRAINACVRCIHSCGLLHVHQAARLSLCVCCSHACANSTCCSVQVVHLQLELGLSHGFVLTQQWRLASVLGIFGPAAATALSGSYGWFDTSPPAAASALLQAAPRWSVGSAWQLGINEAAAGLTVMQLLLCWPAAASCEMRGWVCRHITLLGRAPSCSCPWPDLKLHALLPAASCTLPLLPRHGRVLCVRW